MVHKIRQLPPQVLVPQLLELLEQTQAVPLLVTGGSMNPFLVHGRDTVYLSKVTRPVKRGDILFYQRDNGQYVLHRVCRAEGEKLCLVGDAQTQREPGIRRDQILAVVTAVRRKGKLLEPGSFWWDFFEKVWIRMIPLRPLAVRVYVLLRR